jgi:hypothetical protein
MRLNVLLSIFLISIFTLVANNVPAEEKGCPVTEAMAAEEEAASLKSWQDVYSSYRKYSHCDDGAIAEGYSDSITKLLANNWETLKDLKRFAEADKDFLKFILRHIDATADPEDSQKVYNNASQRCPKDFSNLCSLIRKAAEDAL